MFERYNKILICIIIIVLIIPKVIYSQEIWEDTFTERADVDYRIFQEGESTLSEMLLDATVGKLFSDKIELYIRNIADHNEYDLFGNKIFHGTPYSLIHYLKKNDRLVEVAGGTWRRELRYDLTTKYITGLYGLKVNIGAAEHTIAMGQNIPIFFSPYLLKKLNILGARYDIVKPDQYMIKAITSIRFRENSHNIPGSSRINHTDNFFLGLRGELNIDGFMQMIIPESKEQYLEISYVGENLRNGLKSDKGIESDFFADYTNGSRIINYETLIGLGIRGKGLVNYDLEYVFDNRKEHTVISATDPITYTTKDFSKEYAFTFNLNSENILANIKNYQGIFNIHGWYISPYYGAEEFVDDDDDNDGWLDENPWMRDNFFPYIGSWYAFEGGDQGYDEPMRAVIPVGYNKNENTIPDYMEDFLLFSCDRNFQKSMIFEDANYNGIIDYEEDDADPDFTYDRNRQGIKSVLGFKPFSLPTILGGILYNEKIHDKETSKAYTMGIMHQMILFEVLEFKGTYLFERVFDNIEDDYLSLKDRSLINDTLFYKDNVINKILFTLNFITVKDMTVEFKVRRTYNKNRVLDIKNNYSQDIFKIGYQFQPRRILESLIIAPQFKIEKFKNIYIYEEDLSEIYCTDNKIISDQSEDYILKAIGLTLRYGFLGGYYFMAGAQWKELDKRFYKKDSATRITLPVQFVIKGTKPKATGAFTVGYQYIKEDKKYIDEKYKESVFFCKFIVAI